MWGVEKWIPACAGMTEEIASAYKRGLAMTFLFWVPVFAGMQGGQKKVVFLVIFFLTFVR